MTRGTLYIIENYKDFAILHSSCEFNGDMYDQNGLGHYQEVVSRLQQVNTLADFYKKVLEFDLKHFQYQAEGTNYFEFYRTVMRSKGSKRFGQKPEKEKFCKSVENTIIDLSVDYFEHWFSDYLYFKILGNQPVTFICSNGKEVIAQDGETVTFYFGNEPIIHPKVKQEPKQVR